MTNDRDRGVRSHLWSRDSTRILFHRDAGGDENHHLFAVDSAGGDRERDLTPFPGVRGLLIAAPRATPRHVLVSMNRRDPLGRGRLPAHARDGRARSWWPAIRGTSSAGSPTVEGRVRAARAQTPEGDFQLLVRDERGRRVRGRGRVRQRGRRPPLRVHGRRVAPAGGQRPRLRPAAPGGARPGRRIRAPDRRRRRGRPLRADPERPHRRAAGGRLPARPDRHARHRPRAWRATGSGCGTSTRATRTSAARTPRRRPSSWPSTTTATRARPTSTTARAAPPSCSTARGPGSTRRPWPRCAPVRIESRDGLVAPQLPHAAARRRAAGAAGRAARARRPVGRATPGATTRRSSSSPTAGTPCCRSTTAAPPASARRSPTRPSTSSPAGCTTTSSTG